MHCALKLVLWQNYTHTDIVSRQFLQFSQLICCCLFVNQTRSTLLLILQHYSIEPQSSRLFLNSFCNNKILKMNPIVRIVEQQSEKSFRFRYISEYRSTGTIVNTTSSNKSFPKIEISNYTGNAVIVISCVSDTYPFCSYPHK